jgi:hypothetical protein
MTSLYTIKIAANAQPAIMADDVGLYRLATAHATITTSQMDGREYVSGKPHVFPGNDGERRVHGVTDAAGFIAAIKATGAKTRKCKNYIKVTPPASMLNERDRLDAIWQDMARAGRTDFGNMRGVMLNAM